MQKASAFQASISFSLFDLLRKALSNALRRARIIDRRAAFALASFNKTGKTRASDPAFAGAVR